MAYTTIDKPTDYFNTVLFTGNGSTQSITGVGFQPDWTWIKCRNVARDHTLTDSVRGATKTLVSNSTQVESTLTSGLTSFDSDGFTLGGGNAFNGNTETHASWNWLAGGSASSNTDGSITSSVSANTTAGFSIVSYTGTGANATVGHGLGVVPQMYIVKNRDYAEQWDVYFATLGATKNLSLDSNREAVSQASRWNNTEPTSSVFSLGTAESINNSGDDLIAYCFAEKKGYSKFGSYTGNGSLDGTFVYTGFKPAFVLTKKTSSSTARNWCILDNKRSSSGANVVNDRLFPNLSDAEDSSTSADFLSNGFKFRDNAGEFNQPVSYIYMAFAENPFVTSTGIPCTAR